MRKPWGGSRFRSRLVLAFSRNIRNCPNRRSVRLVRRDLHSRSAKSSK